MGAAGGGFGSEPHPRAVIAANTQKLRRTAISRILLTIFKKRTVSSRV
jgi:hypothetical protein